MINGLHCFHVNVPRLDRAHGDEQAVGMCNMLARHHAAGVNSVCSTMNSVT